MAPVLLIAKERADARGIKLILGDSADGFNGLPYIHVDALRYKQVLLNIITNAVKFTPVGGTVRVDGRLLQDGGLDIIVRDTGIGMKEEDIPKALERFGQVDSALHRKYEGTGLGLPISKTLIELHGGALKLESKLNVGTTAVVHLPSSRVLFDPASGEMHEKKRPLMAE
jgi:two-component system cell cycle sensor histidine kinase PleC